MEIHDLFDKNRKFLGKTIQRGDKVPNGCFRQVVHVALFNSEGKMLIQQRQPWKTHPNMWDMTCGGSVISGEESWQGAQRELFEELEIKIDLSNSVQSLTITFQNEFTAGFDDFYIINKDVNLSELVLQKSEVKDARWAEKDEILHMIKSGEFINYKNSLIEYLFESKDNKFGTQKN